MSSSLLFGHSLKEQRFQPVILVTGCSSGIGLAMAHLLFSQTQYRVVVTARVQSLENIEKSGLQETERFWIRRLNVSSPRERQELMAEIESRWGGVDILINNAGMCFRSVVEHMDDEDEIHQLNANYIGPMALTRLVLPHMRHQGRGKIINVSSVSGMLAMPTMSSYSASKYALEGASEALWYEMKPLGINVSLVQPGFVHSESFRRVRYSKKAAVSEASDQTYSDYYQNMTPFIERMMKWSRKTPEQIAELILGVIQTQNPPLRLPATFDAVVFYYLRRFLPRALFHRVLFFCLPGARKWATKYSRARHLKKAS